MRQRRKFVAKIHDGLDSKTRPEETETVVEENERCFFRELEPLSLPNLVAFSGPGGHPADFTVAQAVDWIEVGEDLSMYLHWERV